MVGMLIVPRTVNFINRIKLKRGRLFAQRGCGVKPCQFVRRDQNAVVTREKRDSTCEGSLLRHTLRNEQPIQLPSHLIASANMYM